MPHPCIYQSNRWVLLQLFIHLSWLYHEGVTDGGYQLFIHCITFMNMPTVVSLTTGSLKKRSQLLTEQTQRRRLTRRKYPWHGRWYHHQHYATILLNNKVKRSRDNRNIPDCPKISLAVGRWYKCFMISHLWFLWIHGEGYLMIYCSDYLWNI